MSDGPLRLTDQDFWFEPLKNEAEVIQTLASEDFVGLVLDAPSLIDVSRRRSFPLQGVRAETLRESLSLPPFASSAILVGIRLDRNQTTVDFAEDQHQPLGPRLTEDPGEGFCYQGFRLEVRSRLRLPWAASKLAVWVLQRDRISNRTLTTLVDRPAPGYEDAAVAAYVEAHQETPFPLPVWPRAAPEREPDSDDDQPLPWYRALDESPPVPDERGIVLTTERVIVVRDGLGSCILRGSFRLSVMDREVVRPCAESEEEQAALLAFEPPAPTTEEGEGVDYLTDAEVHWPPKPLPEPPPSYRPNEPEWRFPGQDSAKRRSEEGPWESGHVWQDVGDDDATAVIPITLVVTGSRLADPYVLHMRVPTTDAISGDDPEVTGRFTLDLLAFKDSYAMRGQTSWIYAFSGGHCAGPVAAALLSPDDLP